MFCPNCGSRLPDNTRFCDECGAAVGAAPARDSQPRQAQLQDVSDVWIEQSTEQPQALAGSAQDFDARLNVEADITSAETGGVYDEEAKKGGRGWPVLITATLIAVVAIASIALVPFQIGGTLTIGSYNGKPITWRILDTADGRFLVIAEDCVTVMAYNKWVDFKDVACTWETSSLRRWLNGDFYSAAFTENEKEMIAEAVISNPDNAEYGMEGGNDTTECVFLLSIDEVKEYFGGDEDRIAEYEGKPAQWWLRFLGSFYILAAAVSADGRPNYDGISVHYEDGAVRLALYVSIPKS
jgi:hypothetical protein